MASTPFLVLAATATLLASAAGGGAQPRVYDMGLAITSLVDETRLPEHLAGEYGALVARTGVEAASLLERLGRCRVVPWRVDEEGRTYRYEGDGEADFVTHLVIHKVQKAYRNRAFYGGVTPPLYAAPGAGDDAASGGDTGMEIVSEPVVTARLELRLYDPARDRTFWSSLRDSAAVVAYDSRLFVYNPSKHPGWTHPQLLSRYMAELMRLQGRNPAAQLMMQGADRWFVSDAAEDLRAARRLLSSLLTGFYADLDGRLPLEGEVAAVAVDSAGEARVILNLGAHHGLTEGLRLDVWRPDPADRKVGQVEVLAADTTTALARVRKLERGVRRAGESVARGDRVVSRQRRSQRQPPPR